jgi:hypothetical protein
MLDTLSQKGLEAILSKRDESNPDAQAMSAIVRQAKVFYFNQYVSSYCVTQFIAKRLAASVTGNNITAEEVQAYEKARPAESSAEKRILTFAELQQLIEAGKLDEIPNNKHIPDGLSVSSPSPLLNKLTWIPHRLLNQPLLA